MSLSGKRIAVAIGAEMRASPGKAAVLLVGAALLVVLVIRIATKGPAAAEGSETPGAAAVSAGSAPAVAAYAAPAPAPLSLLPRPVLAHTLRRDPFDATWLKPGTMTTAAAPKGAEDEMPTLQFTLIDGTGRPRAVIAGNVVTEGSRLGEFLVVRIGRREAVLRKGEQEFTLRMQDW